MRLKRGKGLCGRILNDLKKAGAESVIIIIVININNIIIITIIINNNNINNDDKNCGTVAIAMAKQPILQAVAHSLKLFRTGWRFL